MFNKIFIYENDELGKIIELKKLNLIEQLVKNTNFLFYLILNQVIESIENNSIENLNNIMDYITKKEYFIMDKVKENKNY